VDFVERVAAPAPYTYTLVSEDGEAIGDAHAESEWVAGDLVPCHGSIYEVVAIVDVECVVRRVL
jgi:hypothetical protein